MGTLAIIVSIWISYNGIRADHEWNRRRYTIEIIGSFEPQVVKYRETLTKYFPALYLKEKRGRLEPGIAHSIWKLEVKQDSNLPLLKNSDELKKVRNDLIGLLNYLEYLAQAYHEHVVDQDAFEESLADAVILYHDYLEEFIKASQDDLGYPNWEPISRLVTIIRDKRKRSISTKGPTG